MKTKELSLCGTSGDPSTCPAVSISHNAVSIGEDKNTVKLTPLQWNRLVDLIKKGKLKKV